ncbi:2-oxo acid dehydrogenase subunit E2 [Hujiaoplasma nucleasis]|uniref:Dihydrolipoamide acetyltransferase component of pyruvate dehydrogenase complex n=1 Tax=Hujiaoplasma nucleasis TaxID=2725268 RepID=A0A7L6N1T7_9MOLU|nr:dihydrolipoamide acetyltransferase family protein [Hujiaoplasma nucleasis]QLY40216.1 2-oxo acid dehydrogenase subunit E2 [Hujiaoplasma nucleasis]
MFDFKFADIGEGIHEGKILEWKYKQGDKVEEGETLVIIETDKVNAEIPIPVDGTIVKLGPPEGEIIQVGDLLARIDDGEGDSEEASEEKTEKQVDTKEDDNIEEDEGGVVGKLESSDEMIESYETKSEKSKSERVLATPVARKLASDLNIDIQEIKGSGEHGRVLKEDIENHKGQSQKQTNRQGQKVFNAPEIKVYEADRREKISSLRKSVVNAMTLSKQVIPHTTLIDELDVTDLVNFRNDHKGKAADEGVKLTYMAFIIKALTKAIKDYPILNASFDQINEEIIYRSQVNVGIAVDTPDGLIVPNIKNADTLSLFDIARKVEEIASLAKERKIQLSDLQRGTISITNFGAFDAISGTPIIKHPEVAILGIGKIDKKPVVRNNEIVIRDILPLSLTFDHRIIDGADGGRAMRAFKKYLKDPLLLLMN